VLASLTELSAPTTGSPRSIMRRIASLSTPLLTLVVCLVGASALAQDAKGDVTPEAASAPERTKGEATGDEKASDGEDVPKPSWDVSISGYFRAPIMLGVSHRPDPERPGGPRHLQLTYAPNRLVDADYDSFGYTRLEESDWAEVYVTAKRPHVEATVAFMGGWYGWAGYGNANAGWLPAQAWVGLNTDIALGALKPHVDLKGGVFWQRWGMFEKYDTYLFGRFHQAGAAVEAHLPFAGGAEARFVEGFGTNRNGAEEVGTGLTLLHYAHLGVRYKKRFDLGLYYNSSWARDPTLFVPGDMTADSLEGLGPNGEPGGGNYADARAAHMNVFGADLNLRLPHVGHAWVAASHIDVTNGWALPNIVEVMHSPGGLGVAQNYLGWGEAGSSGSGTVTNLALLYENSLRGLAAEPEGGWPDLALGVFGMLARARRDLLPGAVLADDLTQLKCGTDLTLKLYPWLAFMLRYDSVDLDTAHSGRAFRVITPRVTFTSHVLSTESIWLQYSRYFYDDDVVLETSPSQPYPNPDKHVVKLQANLSF
jgi:hypothetical protein